VRHARAIVVVVQPRRNIILRTGRIVPIRNPRVAIFHNSITSRRVIRQRPRTDNRRAWHAHVTDAIVRGRPDDSARVFVGATVEVVLEAVVVAVVRIFGLELIIAVIHHFPHHIVNSAIVIHVSVRRATPYESHRIVYNRTVVRCQRGQRLRPIVVAGLHNTPATSTELARLSGVIAWRGQRCRRKNRWPAVVVTAQMAATGAQMMVATGAHTLQPDGR
jgi:hypothetical protein